MFFVPVPAWRVLINKRNLLSQKALRFVERQDEGRARGCAPVPGQGIGAALRCLFRMATGGQAPYVEPWDLEKNKTPQNKLIQTMFSPSRGRLMLLARRLATIQMFFATSAVSEGTSPSVQEVHAGVWKEVCTYVMTADGKKVLSGPALEDGKLKQVVEDLQTESEHAGARFDQAPSGPVMAPSSIAKEDPLQQMASFLTGLKRGGGGGGRGDEIEETRHQIQDPSQAPCLWIWCVLIPSVAVRSCTVCDQVHASTIACIEAGIMWYRALMQPWQGRHKTAGFRSHSQIVCKARPA